MNTILYILFISIFFIDYLIFNLKILPRHLALIPEMLTILVTMAILFLAAVNKSIATSTKYFVLLLIYCLHLVAGIISNATPAGVILSGIRIYLKYIPFFFLPAVYEFSDRDIAKQFKFLLICTIIQLPVAVYQRFIESKGSLSGDAVRGTLNNSSTLSVFLICGIALLLAFLYKKRIKRSLFFIIFFLFFLPTTINETKGTVILLPVALIVTTFFMSGIKRKSKQILFVLAALFALASIFEPIYDHYQKPRYGLGIRDFFTSERGGMRKSVYKGLSGENSVLRPGRVDAVILPFEILGKEPHKLIFGLGIGNVSFSFLKGFSGEYTKYNFLIRASMSNLLWEIGILGVILFLAFFCLVFLDAYRLRRSDDLSGAIALGWTAVVVILVLSLFYINYIHRNVIVYLFWYISGYIAAKACRARVSPRPSVIDSFGRGQLM